MRLWAAENSVRNSVPLCWRIDGPSRDELVDSLCELCKYEVEKDAIVVVKRHVCPCIKCLNNNQRRGRTNERGRKIVGRKIQAVQKKNRSVAHLPKILVVESSRIGQEIERRRLILSMRIVQGAVS